MSFIEQTFLCVLYAMYLYDCVFWLAGSEQAFTRTSAHEWKHWRAEPRSFTLLGRRPLLAGPLLIRPGFLRLQAEASVSERSLRELSRRLDRLYALRTLCRGQAVVLLVYVPALLALHRLTPLWHVALGLLISIHAVLCFLATQALRSARPHAWLTPAASLLLNPLGATRALDIIAQAFFDQQQARRGALNSRKPKVTLKP